MNQNEIDKIKIQYIINNINETARKIEKLLENRVK